MPELREVRPRRRIWVQRVAVEADNLLIRLNVARAGDLSPAQTAVAEGVADLAQNARAAALRHDPMPRRWGNWWRGTLVDVAFHNLHSARAQMVDLMDEAELRAEVPVALARARRVLRRDDARLVAAERWPAELNGPGPVDRIRPGLRRLIDDSYEQLDLEHARLRNFRNVVLISAMCVFVLVVIAVVVVSRRPDWIPLCFPNEETTAEGVSRVVGLNCPTRAGAGVVPVGADVVVVAMLGSLGGAMSAALSVRHLKGTSTPYDVPVALAFLKIPLGAFTAILALVAIQGKFVPGLSVLDSQGQILAYALVFGFAQQAFTRLIDRKAQDLLEGLPGGETTTPTQQSSPPPVVPPAPPPGPASDGGAGPVEDVEVVEINEPLQPSPDEPADDALLPVLEETEYAEDDQVEAPPGPDTGDGVDYPKEVES